MNSFVQVGQKPPSAKTQSLIWGFITSGSSPFGLMEVDHNLQYMLTVFFFRVWIADINLYQQLRQYLWND